MTDAEVAMNLMDLTLGDTAMEPDGTINNARREGRTYTQEEKVQILEEALRGEAKTPAEVAGETDLDEEWVEHRIGELRQKRATPIVEEDGGYRWT